jgi:hypothetical protein
VRPYGMRKTPRPSGGFAATSLARGVDESLHRPALFTVSFNPRHTFDVIAPYPHCALISAPLAAAGVAGPRHWPDFLSASATSLGI